MTDNYFTTRCNNSLSFTNLIQGRELRKKYTKSVNNVSCLNFQVLVLRYEYIFKISTACRVIINKDKPNIFVVLMNQDCLVIVYWVSLIEMERSSNGECD